jgi:hypothetical protein
VGSYEDKYIQWTTLRQQRGQDVHEITNLFHTLRTKLGIKYSEKHLVLKYRSFLHRYIQEEMEFLDISSLGVAYRYAAKIEQKFKQKKRDFGSANQKHVKGTPKPQNKGPSQGRVAQDNLPTKPQAKNNTTKPKKDTGKWCEFHKSSTHNKSECRGREAVVGSQPNFFDYSQKAAYTPCGIMRNHCHFLLIDIRFIFRDNFNSISFVVFHNCKCENTSFRRLYCRHFSVDT